MGGRLYSGKNGWQNISKLGRTTITFDGKPTVEPDFSGLHINMLYAMAKQPAPAKPYDMVLNDETMRPIVKKMMLVAINTRNDEETIGVMQKDREELRLERKKTGGLGFNDFQMYRLLNQRTISWWELLERIKEVHAPIKQYLCTDRGGELMNRDSKIILDVILTLIREGIPCLPVHDSVVVPTENKDRAREVMREVFFNHMGSECEVKF